MIQNTDDMKSTEPPVPVAGPRRSVRHITPETKRALEEAWKESMDPGVAFCERTTIELAVLRRRLMALEFQRNALATALRKMLEETTGAADPGDMILATLATIRKQIEACPKMETAVKIMQEDAMKDLTAMDAISDWFSYAEAPK